MKILQAVPTISFSMLDEVTLSELVEVMNWNMGKEQVDRVTKLRINHPLLGEPLADPRDES